VKEPERLSGELEALLDAERDIEAPGADARARLLARLGPIVIPGAIGAGVGAAAASGASGTETAATSKAAGLLGAGVKAKLVVAAIAGAVGAVGGAMTHAALTRPPVPKLAPTTVAPTPIPPPPAASAPPLPEPVQSALSAPTSAPSAVQPARSGASTAASLRTERLLLERATAALMRGDANSALAALHEHARRFPQGELAEEREVLLVRALRAAGQNDAAEKQAKDFKQKFPSSLQSGTLDASPSAP
jgi:hypothetical protein